MHAQGARMTTHSTGTFCIQSLTRIEGVAHLREVSLGSVHSAGALGLHIFNP